MNKFFKHTDGGLYELLYIATSSSDLTEICVYKHIFPFELKIWTRPLAEWQSRFSEITELQLAQYVSENKEVAQKRITDAKNIRKQIK